MLMLRCSCVIELVVVAPGRSRLQVTRLDPRCDYAAHRSCRWATPRKAGAQG